MFPTSFDVKTIVNLKNILQTPPYTERIFVRSTR